MKNKNTAIIILAAGKSTRMKSDIPKVLHSICGRPILSYALDLAGGLKGDKVIVVLGHKQEVVKRIINPGIKVVIQKRLLGTADAVKAALPSLGNFKGTILILYADNPLLKEETIKKLLKFHVENNADVTLLTAKTDQPHGYGRILRDKYASICGIVEEKEAQDFQKDTQEINTGILCFKKESLNYALRYIKPNNLKKEYYLTDAIGILYRKGYLIEGMRVSDIDEVVGINSRQDLARANKIMQARINDKFMKEGVTIIDPKTTFINHGTEIGPDTTIYPFTVIDSNVKIGRRCSIGPFARLRKGTRLEDEVAVGNFIEIVRSRLHSKARAKHFGYLGDSKIGRSVNIGAGTVTANYDGKNKNTTVIEDNAFIGSDTILVAPVKIGKSAKTGAGSVVVRNSNIPAKTVVVGVPAKPLKKVKR